MDSPNTYPESPMDQEDVVYPCKGCGEVRKMSRFWVWLKNRPANNDLMCTDIRGRKGI